MTQHLIDEGFILHRYPYRETSMILECFLQHHGRASFIAKGVRTARSSLKGILQPFLPLHIEARGKSQLKTITLAEPTGAPILLKEITLMSGWYMNELLMRLLPKEEAHARLYFIYRATLLALESDSMLEKALRIFERNLLESLGYALPLTHDVDSKRAIVFDHHYQLIPEHGFVITVQQEGKDVFIGEDLMAIAHDHYVNERVLASAKRLMRLAMRPLLGDKPLKTRELFKKMLET